MGGRKTASLRGRRKQRRLGQHEAALQRERLLTEIQILSEQAPSQVGFTHKAGVLLGTAWFQATRSRKQGYIARSRLDVAVARVYIAGRSAYGVRAAWQLRRKGNEAVTATSSEVARHYRIAARVLFRWKQMFVTVQIADPSAPSDVVPSERRNARHDPASLERLTQFSVTQRS
jgi:hypothetical protein